MSSTDDWSESVALRKSARASCLAALILAVVTFPLAWYFPPVVLTPLLRAFEAFVLAWIVLAVAQHSSGTVGWPITSFAIFASAIVLLSHHVAFAVHGVPTLRSANGTATMFEGWGWFSLSALVATNVTAGIGLGAAVLLGHRGANLDVILDIFNQRVR